MTSCFVARISNPGERFGKPFYEVDVPSPLSWNLDPVWVMAQQMSAAQQVLAACGYSSREGV